MKAPGRKHHHHLQSWEGVLWVLYYVFSYGLAAAVHVCGLLSNALVDIAIII
jgi:hypothetical protein